MPLSRPALLLRTGSRAVQDARAWVRAACEEIERTDLVECAEFGVSELVSNALFHGTAPVTIRMRGTVDHPRVEIRDASTEPPLLPVPLALDDEEEVLLTVGRGLSIVASVSDAWGADIDASGKTVWFTPASEIDEGDGVEGVITGPVGAPPKPERLGSDTVDVSILGVPLALYKGFQHHFRELRREVRLLSLAHADDYPLAASLSALFGSLERQLLDGLGHGQLSGVIGHGPGSDRETADLHVRMPRSAAETMRRFLDMLDLIDEFCRQERLLVLARSPEQVAFQRWFLGEYLTQAAGGRPTRWSAAQMAGPRF
ncbi:ATP-binding protein [Nocardioides sp. KC13]|uniref:ATP-binding protein n=1 Tax=Nocardioides turkmenicus TaxID=2711220 RepID=A0A6M1R4I8_9ACTN|nr:ATP-binding protein [Nocardioides sp. KC13]NGN93611.1 ATP-binding protein [Nocardioides sp. KC13]